MKFERWFEQRCIDLLKMGRFSTVTEYINKREALHAGWDAHKDMLQSQARQLARTIPAEKIYELADNAGLIPQEQLGAAKTASRKLSILHLIDEIEKETGVFIVSKDEK